MKRAFFTQRRLFASVCILLLVASVLPAHWAGLISRWPRHVMEIFITPISHPLRSVMVKLVEQPKADHATVDSLRKERDDYLRQVNKLRLEVDLLRERNMQLAQINRMTAGSSGQRSQSFINASVVSSAVTFGQPSIRINRGAKSGIKLRDVVVQDINLVGRVVDVGPVSATVSLITAPQTSLMVRIVTPGPTLGASLEALLEVAPDGRSFIGVVNANQSVKVNDLAYLADNNWPPDGFIVGRVTSVKPLPNDALRQVIKVEPQNPLWSLREVVVIVNDLQTDF